MSVAIPIVSLRDVHLTYHVRKQILSRVKRRVKALRGVSFDLYRGEKLGVVGRNGSGKSTLFQILAGIFSPDRGCLEKQEGLNIQLLTLGVGFEANLTGRENAILNGMLLGKTRKYMKERAEAIKKFSELGDFFEMPVYTYSTGMSSRLGFSVAMEANPDVLLVDEVLGVGDAEFQRKSQEAIMRRFGSESTVVLVTHSHEEILKLCDRVLWIEFGEVVADGDPHRVVQQYLEALSKPVDPMNGTVYG